MTAEQVLAEMDSPSFVPTVKVGKVLHEGDSIQYMEMNNVYVYPQLTFKNKKQAQAYMRLVTNVKKVLPIAKEAKQLLYETTEVLETIPTKEGKEEHMKKVENEIFKTYKPRMKKLTYSQGKLLIKLIDRECHSSSYEMIKAFMGPFRKATMPKASTASPNVSSLWSSPAKSNPPTLANYRSHGLIALRRVRNNHHNDEGNNKQKQEFSHHLIYFGGYLYRNPDDSSCAGYHGTYDQMRSSTRD